MIFKYFLQRTIRCHDTLLILFKGVDDKMKFELSERLNTGKDRSVLIGILEEKFRNISPKVDRTDNGLFIRAIRAFPGSAFRLDITDINLIKKEYGYLCTADVTYIPSITFVIAFLLGLFSSGILWLIPVYFYITQKRAIYNVIQSVLKRVKDEVE